MESFAGLVDGEVSQWNRYPLQKPRPASVSGSREVMVTDPALIGGWSSPNRAVPIDPQLSDPDRDCAIVTSPSHPGSKETIVTSIEDTAGEPMEGITESMPADPRPRKLDPHTPAPPEDSLIHEHNGLPTGSPPQISPARRADAARPNSMSPNWSRPSKGTSRSGKGKTTTPKTTPGGKGRRDSKDSIRLEPKSEQKLRAVSSSTGEKNEDMASLALALQLQMEEHGLRRRSK
jgi:F-box/leucine-rich repeat protein 10/11